MKSGAAQTIRIGTRGSLLARTQTEHVMARLRSLHPGLNTLVEIIQTTGDLRRDLPFNAVGVKGMFVKEIEQALLAGTVDLGVHSLKDMPGELPEGLGLACVPAREDPRDALLTRDGATLETLREGALVGTSSLRRQAQLRAYRPDLQFTQLRGNLDTRLRKLDAQEVDAIVLACAGLNRLGLEGRITERIAPSICVPAVGQGALALETRAEDRRTQDLLAALHDPITADCVAAERGFQAELQAGCTVPAGAYATLHPLHADELTLTAAIAAPDGSRQLRATRSMRRDRATALGALVARELLDRGGWDLLKGDIDG